jgi:predicted transcriptional regulator
MFVGTLEHRRASHGGGEGGRVKNPKQLERIVRGFSNHRRIEILRLLDSKGEFDLTGISRELGINFKTCFEHARRLAIAGLVYKRFKGASVLHTISPRGRKVLMFLRTLESSRKLARHP